MILLFIIIAWIVLYFFLKIEGAKKPFNITNIIIFVPITILGSLLYDLMVGLPIGKTLGEIIGGIFFFACVLLFGAMTVWGLIGLVMGKAKEENEEEWEDTKTGYESSVIFYGFFLVILLVWYFN